MSAIHKMRSSFAPAFALVDTDITQNNTDSPSFANMDAGRPVVGRVLIVVITTFDNDFEDDDYWPATCTIGGVTANLQRGSEVGVGGVSVGSAVYSAVVPNGSSVTVNITIAFGGTMDDWACALFRATDVSATAVATGQGTTSVVLDTSLAKFAVMGTVDRDGTPGAWTGGGNVQTAVAHGNMTIGYDDAPLGGASDVYDSSGADRFTGAAFG